MRTVERAFTRQEFAILLAVLVVLSLQKYGIVRGVLPTLLCLTLATVGFVWFWRASQHRALHPAIPKAATPSRDSQSNRGANVEVGERPASKPVKSKPVRALAKLYAIRVPKGTKWNPAAAYQLMLKAIAFPRLAFGIEARGDQIEFQIVDLAGSAPESIVQAIRSIYADAQVEVRDYFPPPFVKPYYRLTAALRQSGEFVAPITYVEHLKDFDPLTMLTNLMGDLGEGERFAYHVFVGEIAEKAAKEGRKRITKSGLRIPSFNAGTAMGWTYMLATAMVTASRREDKYRSEDMRVLESKLASPMFNTQIVMQLDIADSGRLENVEILTPLLGFSTDVQSILPLERDPYVVVDVADERTHVQTDAIATLRRWQPERVDKLKTQSILNVSELAALWHLPHDGFTSPHLAWVQKRTFVPIPRALRGGTPAIGVCVGTNGVGITQTHHPVYIASADRAMHTTIVGKTGVGKSTLLHNLIHQDIEQGYGVAVIDPKGDLVRDVLQRSIPPERVGDVIYLDFSSDDSPPPLNPLAIPPGADRDDAAGRVMTIFESVYDGFTGQMADTLYMALLTVMHDDCPTLRDVSRLFRDVNYRYQLIDKLDSPAAEDFWATFNSLSSNDQGVRAQPVEHRLRTFYSNKTLYPISCHPDSLDFRRLMEEGKILLVSFSLDAKSGKIPPREQRLLGAVLVQQLQMAAMSGAALEQPFYVYIDETQHFVTSPLNQVLSEARSRNVSLTLANQYLKQLDGDTLEAVMGNVGAMIALESDEATAKTLIPYFKPHFATEDLVNLGAYQAAIRMRYEGKHVDAFSLATICAPDLPSRGKERANRIIEMSRSQYTPRTRAEVLAWLEQRYPKPSRNGHGGENDDAAWYHQE